MSLSNGEILAVHQDLLNEKAWYSGHACFNHKVNRSYIVAKHMKESSKSIVLPVKHDESVSPQWLMSLFEILLPPGDLDIYEEGLLLAVVGDSSSIVYHRVMPGIESILHNPKMKRS